MTTVVKEARLLSKPRAETGNCKPWNRVMEIGATNAARTLGDADKLPRESKLSAMIPKKKGPQYCRGEKRGRT